MTHECGTIRRPLLEYGYMPDTGARLLAGLNWWADDPRPEVAPMEVTPRVLKMMMHLQLLELRGFSNTSGFPMFRLTEAGVALWRSQASKQDIEVPIDEMLIDVGPMLLEHEDAA